MHGTRRKRGIKIRVLFQVSTVLQVGEFSEVSQFRVKNGYYFLKRNPKGKGGKKNSSGKFEQLPNVCCASQDEGCSPQLAFLF